MIQLPTMMSNLQDRDIYIDSDMMQLPTMKNSLQDRDIY